MYSTQQSGFSLVETLVAMTLLMIVVVGPMTISINASKSTSYSSEQVTAFFLAQEGAELVQNERDEFMLNSSRLGGGLSDPWSEFTDTSSAGVLEECYTSNGCGLYSTAGTAPVASNPANCGSSGACRLYFDASGERGRYTHVSSGNEPTIFERRIYLTETAAGEVRVRSTVSWFTDSARAQQTVTAETYLYEIYEN